MCDIVAIVGNGCVWQRLLEGIRRLKDRGYNCAGICSIVDDEFDRRTTLGKLANLQRALCEKTVSNMQDVRARGGRIVLISDGEGLASAGEACIATNEMPRVHPLFAPVYSVPVKLITYNVAVANGTDVDQQRNLAKSVTVE